VEGSVRDLVADASRVYALGPDNLIARKADTGDEVWRTKAHGVLALSRNRLLAGSLTCLDPGTGSEIWKRELDVTTEPVLTDNLVIVAIKDRLVCLSDVNGATLWETKLGGPALSPTVSGDRVFLTVGKAVLCRKLVDGSALWRQELTDAPVSHLVAEGDYLAVATKGMQVLVLRPEDGELAETVYVDDIKFAPALARDLLIVTAKNRVGAYDLLVSEWRWSFLHEETLGEVAAPPVVCCDTLWVSSVERGLTAIDLGQALGVRK
jgi:outer membrane protein assembly factor BamB